MNVKQWMSLASEQERKLVAKRANTSVGYLWQLSGEHRKPSAAKAGALEEASRFITPDRVMDRYTLVFGNRNVAA